jgi:DNA-binding response OmpR family regulator
MKADRPCGRRRIVVVDDSEVWRILLRTALAQAGYDVDALKSPFELGTALFSRRPNAVVVDLNMPGLRGDDLIAVARRSRSDVPFVLHSDRPDAELAQRAASCGADRWVRKSSDLTPLVACLRALLDRA